jgi:hypothetical protein|tara:strand:+ start:2960 stop:3124 length:165 start_codon:yes stop_codon:yes gene_type:complete
MKYRIVKGATTGDLEANMRDFLAEGWKPHGSLQLNVRDNGYVHMYLQPVVKEDN